jgi:alkanesulfonate monooxygenase SsuD/methylene tetrahydromethanopterin reductase-like flavin-dependent oxidoreductase (luciferase family)
MANGSRDQATADETERAAPASIEVGLFDWVDRGPGSLVDIYERRLRMVEYADRAGYYCYMVAEHHGTPLGMAPSPSLLLASAAQRTRRIRLGPLVYVLPLYNPMRLAQEVCMLDQLSRGRLELGIGRGSSPNELVNLGVDPAETREMYREALEILLLALTTGRVTYEGQYNRLTDVRLEVEPYQRPYPPLWYPTSNPDTIPWVAENGYQLLLSFNTPTLEENRRRISLYREALPRAAANPARVNAHVRQPYYGIVRKVYVAETDGEARRVAREALDVFRHNFAFLLSADRPTHYQEDRLSDLEQAMENGVLFVGSPTTVRERLLQFMEGCGGNYFGGVFAWGSLTDDQVMRSLDLFTRDVLPALRGRAVARA